MPGGKDDCPQGEKEDLDHDVSYSEMKLNQILLMAGKVTGGEKIILCHGKGIPAMAVLYTILFVQGKNY
jgi:hypothetical protein